MSRQLKTRRYGLLSRLVSSILVAVLGTTSIPGIAAGLVAQSSGIGGGPGFPNGAEFPFVAGIKSSLTAGFAIQNLGPDSIELGISHDAPRGILIEPAEGQETIYGPGEARDFLFTVTVTEPVVPGTYPININIREEEPADPEEGGSFYIPAISGTIVIDVVGASATAKLSTISALTGSPATGDLALFYLGSSGSQIQINEANASTLETEVVPGNYKFTFSVPGLQRQDFNFSISENEVLDLVYEIPTLEFLGVGAVPTRDDRGYIQAVELSMDIYNNLDLIEEQVFFQASISRDGEFVEEFVIGASPDLAQERTNLSANYIREDGFAQGDWSFEFQIVGESFSVASDQIAVISSPGIFQSYLQEIIIAIGALVIIALLLPKRWWAFILRRSRHGKPTPDSSLEDDKGTTPKPRQMPELALANTADAKSKERVKQPPLIANWISNIGNRLSTMSGKMKDKTNELRSLNRFGSGKRKSQSQQREANLREPGLSVADKTAPANQKDNSAEEKTQKRIGAQARRRASSDPPFEAKTVNQASLDKAVQIRQELKKLEDEGVKSLALSYQIDSVFVDEGEPVIKRSSGIPYSASEVDAVKHLSKLESSLKSLETPAIREQAIKIVVRGEIAASGSARNL